MAKKILFDWIPLPDGARYGKRACKFSGLKWEESGSDEVDDALLIFVRVFYVDDHVNFVRSPALDGGPQAPIERQLKVVNETLLVQDNTSPTGWRYVEADEVLEPDAVTMGEYDYICTMLEPGQTGMTFATKLLISYGIARWGQLGGADKKPA